MHDSKSQAEEELVRVAIKYGDAPDGPNGFYLCDVCGAYHLTSKSTDTSFIDARETRKRIQRGRDAGKWLDI